MDLFIYQFIYFFYITRTYFKHLKSLAFCAKKKRHKWKLIFVLINIMRIEFD